MTINKEEIYVSYQNKQQELIQRKNYLKYLKFSEINQRAFEVLIMVYEDLKKEVEELEKIIESLENNHESQAESAQIL